MDKQLLEALREVREALQFANDTPNGPINDTIWMMHRPETLFDFIDAAIEFSANATPADPETELTMLRAARHDEMHGITATLRNDRIEELETQLGVATPSQAAKDAQFPATKTAHWPSGSTHACDDHAAQLVGLARFLGSHVCVTLAPHRAECANCKNESTNNPAAKATSLMCSSAA
jgi:hypothetical protein